MVNNVHHPLECNWGVAQYKRHYVELEQAIRCDERCLFFFVSLIHEYLPVP